MRLNMATAASCNVNGLSYFKAETFTHVGYINTHTSGRCERTATGQRVDHEPLFILFPSHIALFLGWGRKTLAIPSIFSRAKALKFHLPVAGLTALNFINFVEIPLIRSIFWPSNPQKSFSVGANLPPDPIHCWRRWNRLSTSGFVDDYVFIPRGQCWTPDNYSDRSSLSQCGTGGEVCYLRFPCFGKAIGPTSSDGFL